MTPIRIVPDPTRKQVDAAAKVISRNDAPILASALMHADYLVTLDKEFSRAISEAQSLTVCTPGELIALFEN